MRRLGTRYDVEGPRSLSCPRLPADDSDHRRPQGPHHPLTLQLLDRNPATTRTHRSVPVTTRCRLEEFQKPESSQPLDQKPHQRNTLGIKSQHRRPIGRILRHPQQVSQSDPPPGSQQLDHRPLLPPPFRQRFGHHRRTLIRPSRNRTTETTGEDGVSQLVRQDRLEHFGVGALQGHLPTKDLATTETECRRSRGSRVTRADQDATRCRPPRHLVTNPSHRQLATMRLRGQCDSSGQRTCAGRDDEVLGPTHRGNRHVPTAHQTEHAQPHRQYNHATSRLVPPNTSRLAPHTAHHREPPCPPGSPLRTTPL